MTVGRVQLLNGPINVPEDSYETMQALEWPSYLSMLMGLLTPYLCVT